jgi:hypothetical protein
MPKDVPSSGKPTREDLDRLLDRVRPSVARLFERRAVSEEEAARLLRDALVRLLYRWGGIRNREGWLLATLKKGIGKKEPEDERP